MTPTLEALITGGDIVLYVSPDDIVREREALSTWFGNEWAAIPRRHVLVKSMLAGGGDAEILEKAAPSERTAAVLLAHKLRAEHGDHAASWASVNMGQEMATALDEYLARAAKIDRLARRSMRFCCDPYAAPGHGH